jgi:hypothetical protein
MWGTPGAVVMVQLSVTNQSRAIRSEGSFQSLLAGIESEGNVVFRSGQKASIDDVGDAGNTGRIV